MAIPRRLVVERSALAVLLIAGAGAVTALATSWRPALQAGPLREVTYGSWVVQEMVTLIASLIGGARALRRGQYGIYGDIYFGAVLWGLLASLAVGFLSTVLDIGMLETSLWVLPDVAGVLGLMMAWAAGAGLPRPLRGGAAVVVAVMSVAAGRWLVGHPSMLWAQPVFLAVTVAAIVLAFVLLLRRRPS
jgi:hypothetical protein